MGHRLTTLPLVQGLKIHQLASTLKNLSYEQDKDDPEIVRFMGKSRAANIGRSCGTIAPDGTVKFDD